MRFASAGGEAKQGFLFCPRMRCGVRRAYDLIGGKAHAEI